METNEQSRNGSDDRFNDAVAALGGTILVTAGRRRGGGAGLLLVLAGIGVAARALYPHVRRGLLQMGAKRRVVHLRHSIVVERPVPEVFAFCRDFENFQRVFGSLRRVVDYQDGRSHWEVSTPAGRRVEWDAVITKYVPNVVIGWSSVPGSPVTSSGLVRFTPTPSGGTLVDVSLDYEPHETALDDAFHALVDVPREKQLRAELDRASFFLKSLPRVVYQDEQAIGTEPQVSA